MGKESARLKPLIEDFVPVLVERPTSPRSLYPAILSKHLFPLSALSARTDVLTPFLAPQKISYKNLDS